MEDLTICPSCRHWKDNLRAMPCCTFKFCDDCVWKAGGCVKCHTKLDFQLLPIYKPINVLIKECLIPCRFCGILQTNLLIKNHEQFCPKIPVSGVIVELSDELKPFQDKTLTVGDMNKYLTQQNLLKSFKGIVLPSLMTKVGNKGTTPSEEFITHIITDADTLVGLSLRYGVSQDEIRRINRLTGHANHVLHGKSVLQIPKTNSNASEDNISGNGNMLMQDSMETALKQRLSARFAKMTGCRSHTEIAYYLEATSYDLEKAVAEYNTDMDWAKKQPDRPITHATPSVAISASKPVRKAVKRSRCCFA